MRPDDRDETRFEISAATGALPESARPEPVSADDASRQRHLRLGVFASLAMHLLPFALFLGWSGAPAEIAAPIPVQLVLEEPPPPAPPPPAPEAKPPPPGRLASVDIGDMAPRPEPAKPAETQVAMASPAPHPTPPPKLVSALPKPVPEPEPLAAAQEPPPPPAARPAKQASAARLPPPSARPAQVPGPEAARDEYLAYCEMLIRGNIGMLPPSFLAGRSGVAILSILILADGTIASVAIKQSSGHRDIDVRAQHMVVTVRRFPPLPQWFPGPNLPVTFHLAFREGAVRFR